MLHLPRLGVAVAVAVGFGRGVVMPGLGLPVGAGMCVKRPVRQVNALQGVGERRRFEAIGGKPALAIPGPYPVAHLAFGKFERQQALRGNGVAQRFVRNDGGRATEIATLGYAPVYKYRNGAAALALHFAPLFAPAALVGRVAQGRV